MPMQGLQPHLCFRLLAWSVARGPAVYAVPSSIASSMTGGRHPPLSCCRCSTLRRSSSSTSLHPIPLPASWPSIHASPSITYILSVVDEKQQSSGELCTLSTWIGSARSSPAMKYEYGNLGSTGKAGRKARSMPSTKWSSVEAQRCDRSGSRRSHREHGKSPAIPPRNPEVAGKMSSRRGHPG